MHGQHLQEGYSLQFHNNIFGLKQPSTTFITKVLEYKTSLNVKIFSMHCYAFLMMSS